MKRPVIEESGPRKKPKIALSLPSNDLRKTEYQIIFRIFNEFDYQIDSASESPTVIQLAQRLMKQYQENFIGGPVTYQHEKALLLGKPGHQSSISSVCSTNLFQFLGHPMVELV